MQIMDMILFQHISHPSHNSLSILHAADRAGKKAEKPTPNQNQTYNKYNHSHTITSMALAKWFSNKQCSPIQATSLSDIMANCVNSYESNTPNLPIPRAVYLNRPGLPVTQSVLLF